MNSTKKTAGKEKSYEGFTEAERGAMKERARELKSAGKVDPEAAVLEKIAEMPEPDRAIAERLHAIIKTNAPELSARLWYGMPAYGKNGKDVCFFQSAEKFKTRYCTLGFNDSANLDDGDLWPTAYAVAKLTPAVEKQLTALIRRAVS